MAHLIDQDARCPYCGKTDGDPAVCRTCGQDCCTACAEGDDECGDCHDPALKEPPDEEDHDPYGAYPSVDDEDDPRDISFPIDDEDW